MEPANIQEVVGVSFRRRDRHPHRCPVISREASVSTRQKTNESIGKYRREIWITQWRILSRYQRVEIPGGIRTVPLRS